MTNKPRLREETEKIQVTFNKSQLELIDTFMGMFGNNIVEVAR